MGKSIIDGIIPTDKGFKLIFSTQGIIALILAIITLVLGTILFIRFILSLPVDKAIFFSSLPFIVLYGLLLFSLAEITSLETPLANSLKTLLNVSRDNIYNTILWAILITIIFIFCYL